MPPELPKVFISYNRADRGRAAGYPVDRIDAGRITKTQNGPVTMRGRKFNNETRISSPTITPTFAGSSRLCAWTTYAAGQAKSRVVNQDGVHRRILACYRSRKTRLANEEEQQHQQQTLSEGCLNQASEAIGRDIPNTAAQAELLRAEQLSLQHNAQLAYYAQAKAQQIDTLQAALQTALHNHVAKLAAIEHHAPAWPANRQARSAWQNQLAQAKTRLAELERRFERVGEIATGAGLYADSLLDELAARKLRFRDPDLARRSDAMQQQQRKAALQKIHSTQTVELDLGRTRALSFSSES